MYGARSIAAASESGSMNGTMKLTPNALVPEASSSSTGANADGGNASPGYIACAPAAATAAGSRADALTLPIGASWIGRSQCRIRHSRSLIGRL